MMVTILINIIFPGYEKKKRVSETKQTVSEIRTYLALRTQALEVLALGLPWGSRLL